MKLAAPQYDSKGCFARQVLQPQPLGPLGQWQPEPEPEAEARLSLRGHWGCSSGLLSFGFAFALGNVSPLFCQEGVSMFFLWPLEVWVCHRTGAPWLSFGLLGVCMALTMRVFVLRMAVAVELVALSLQLANRKNIGQGGFLVSRSSVLFVELPGQFTR